MLRCQSLLYLYRSQKISHPDKYSPQLLKKSFEISLELTSSKVIKFTGSVASVNLLRRRVPRLVYLFYESCGLLDLESLKPRVKI